MDLPSRTSDGLVKHAYIGTTLQMSWAHYLLKTALSAVNLCVCIYICMYFHKQMCHLFWEPSSTEAQTKRVTENTPFPILLYIFITFFGMLIWKTYLEQHLSSELKKEKNKTEMDQTSVPNENTFAYGLTPGGWYKMSPSSCRQTYSCCCDQSIVFVIVLHLMTSVQGPHLALPTMWTAGLFIPSSILVLLWICSKQSSEN